MSKKLKIQFWKAEKALVMQILEQEGLPQHKNDGFIKTEYSPTLGSKEIWLRGREVIYDFYIDSIYFKTNTDRDAYLKNAVNIITEELFTGEGKLEAGEMCEVSDDGVSWHKYRLLAILPDRYEMRFIIENGTLSWCSCKYARPLSKRTEPTVEECGQLITYTWEEK